MATFDNSFWHSISVTTTLNTIAYILFREKLGFEVEFYPPLDITNVENWESLLGISRKQNLRWT
eukprot:UN06493